MRSLRPTIVACLPPENSARVFSASATGAVRQRAMATAKKFNSARLASWRARSGMSSHLVSTTKRARVWVTPGRGSMVFLLAGARTSRSAHDHDADLEVRAPLQQILFMKLDAARDVGGAALVFDTAKLVAPDRAGGPLGQFWDALQAADTVAGRQQL